MQDYPDEMASRWSEFSPGPVQEIPLTYSNSHLGILRLDLIRSWASGNKYFKLKYLLRDALSQGIKVIVSKGGMFSNHLAALSEACLVFNIQLVAVIRSHVPDELNPSIQRLRQNGHEIIYASPAEYKSFGATEAIRLFPGSLFIPEGGLSETGIRGAGEILQGALDFKPSHIVVAGGTMGTACGIVAAAPAGMKVIVVPAWKGCTQSYFCEILRTYRIDPVCSWSLWPDYHFGGFGKFNQELIDFMAQFTKETGIPLDPVYTGKLMFAIATNIRAGFFDDQDSILAIHTGGLQGIEGYKYRFPEEWGSYVP